MAKRRKVPFTRVLEATPSAQGPRPRRPPPRLEGGEHRAKIKGGYRILRKAL